MFCCLRISVLFGEAPKLSMATGTAEVVKISIKDKDISLRGPFGEIHNLDLRRGLDGNPLNRLRVGDCVEFPCDPAGGDLHRDHQLSQIVSWEASARTTSPRVSTPIGVPASSTTNNRCVPRS